jgi:hypothetical protein
LTLGLIRFKLKPVHHSVTLQSPLGAEYSISMEVTMKVVGLNVEETLVATATGKPGDVLGNREMMDKAHRAGKSLASWPH